MIVIGRVKEIYKDNSLPSIKELIQEAPIDGKAKVLKYLKSGKKGACAPGKMRDIISGESINGDLCCYSDGKYGWRSDTIYYFEKYNLRLNPDFVNYVLQQNN